MGGIAQRNTIWHLRPADEAAAAWLAERAGDPIRGRLLAQRGVTPETAEEFLDPAIERLIEAEKLPGVPAAAEAILKRIRAGEEIVVFGDYDADGVCATAILATAIGKLGGKATPFIPHRFDEGYGMTAASLRRMRETAPGAKMVVTVDNGINSVEEIAGLRAEGIAVVVTDHHLPGEELPDAEALVNPRVEACEGCEWLCGAGVAFYLAFALVHAAEREGMAPAGKISGPLLVLAGLATVADIVPVTGQNRILVAEAVKRFGQFAPVGLRELRDHSQRRTEELKARDFAFLIAPRLNAAGRMATAETAYELLVAEWSADGREKARRLAVEVDGLNAMRKTEEARISVMAQRQIASENLDDASCIVVQGDDWHPGVSGIVAARLLEEHNKPVAVVAGVHGSARAPEGYNVRDALGEATEHLDRFGGHAAAGGFTLKPGALGAFRETFSSACANQSALAPDVKLQHFDGWLEPREITMELYDWIHGKLAPLGEGNPEPVFGLSNVRFREIRLLGMEGRHLLVEFVNRDIPRAMWWGHGRDADELRSLSSRGFDVFFTLHASKLEPDTLELWIEDVKPLDYGMPGAGRKAGGNA